MANEEENHLSEGEEFKGILTRNSTYKSDARGRMIRLGLYSAGKYPIVLTAVKKQDEKYGRIGGKNKDGSLFEGKTQSQRAKEYRITHGNNFKEGYTFLPYLHNAHHILPIEVFYEEDWTVERLAVVKQCKYDINNNKNIIYLPQGEKGKVHYCEYHWLPNHAKGHNIYNERIIDTCTPLLNMVDEAVDKGKCKEANDIREKILKFLKKIEEANFNLLKGLGPNPMV